MSNVKHTNIKLDLFANTSTDKKPLITFIFYQCRNNNVFYFMITKYIFVHYLNAILNKDLTFVILTVNIKITFFT